MAVNSVALTDGGRVDWWIDENPNDPKQSIIHSEKFDASGHSVTGGPSGSFLDSTQKHEVLALSGGGYVVASTQFDGANETLGAFVFGPDGQLATRVQGGMNWNIAVSPDGGFAMASLTPAGSAGAPPDERVALYDSKGALVTSAVVSTSGNATPQLSVDGQGTYHATWTDSGGFAHELVLDPEHPTTLTAPPAPVGVGFVDDVGPNTGVATSGGTDDTTPTIRVPVTQAGYVAVTLTPTTAYGGAVEQHPKQFVQVTAADLQAGYKDIAITTPLADGNYAVAARLEGADGIVGATSRISMRVDTATPGAPYVAWADDNVGAHIGTVNNGGTTDDTTPTIWVDLNNRGAQTFDTVQLYDNGQKIGTQVVDFTNANKGYVGFSPTLAAGTHTLTARIVDTAGNVSPDSPQFNITVAAEGMSPPQDHTPAVVMPNGAANYTVNAFESVMNATTTRSDGATGYPLIIFKIDSADGIRDLTIGGAHVIENGADQGANGTGHIWYLSSALGEAPYIAYDPNTQEVRFNYRVWYTYNHANAQTDATGRYASETFNISVTDNDGDVSTGALTVKLYDAVMANPGDDTDQIASGSGNPATGNVITDNEGDPDNGRDWLGVDGGSLVGVASGSASDTTADANGNFEVRGQYGTLKLNTSGEYAYSVDANAPVGATDTFSYTLKDADGPYTVDGHLSIAIGPSGEDITNGHGGAGNDTIHAPQQAQTITTGAGSDIIVWAKEPWSPAEITDFQVGQDKIDFSAVLQASGYSGSDPVRDGYISFLDDGAGGTKVLFDRDAAGTAQQWPNYVMHLQHVPTAGLTWGQLTGASAPPPPPSGGGTAPTLAIQATNGSVTEGGTAQFQVTRGGDTSGATSVQWAVANGTTAAGDFSGATSGTLSFAAGETSKTISVATNGDTVDEADESFQVTLSNAAGAAIATGSASGTIVDNDDPAPSSGGQRIVSDQYGDQLTGGAGEDTLIAGQGPDQLTGAGGADVFRYENLPWNAGHVTDFTVGVDRLDLSALFQAADYSGADPVADGRVTFASDGAGGTKVYFDHDQVGGGDWPFLITTLDHVSVTSWAQLTGGGGSTGGSTGGGSTGGGSTGGGSTGGGTGGTTAGQVFTSDQYGDQIVGTAGDDTINAGQGPDRLTGGAGNDLFHWGDLPWNAGHVTDFTPGADKLDLRALFQAAGYHGSDPVADHYLEFRADGAGNTQVYFDRDGNPAGGDWPYLITTLDGVAPSQIGAGSFLFA